ncbi:tRNA methylase Trm12p Wyeosine biosynthesis [Halarchaeum acidiphilum MH1-52-1]|uniref:tRNA methylase Trm12p Wyeosine biosynthesis n=1 Tax=Halarchaeum acidiphilum MH1-52-1 TaxID=1261545 RepID=U2YGE3_9EURY|nr:class I SAM-dependent methyltransferase family protein [Halarchaeum acidiphilum]GAD53311.1 tRNA methylase Trm12p Wyeosine biosynthesis [Halarchaeum acidiphilum MH1-52-1]
MNALAIVVPKTETEEKLDALDAEGVYDTARKVREHDAERVELPVLAEPRATTFDALVEQDDPEIRAAGLDDYLRERGWDGEEIERAPSSWALIGDVVLVAFPDALGADERASVGEALLDLHGEADTVLAREGVAGEAREPDVTVVAGSGDTETIHTEHGTRYALDLADVLFAPGNQAERVRMGEVVSADERVLDMFAGIGYFALPMARAGASVVAVERNPAAFRYLAENAQLNGVADRVECVLGDCREYDATESFDRVVMGYYDSLGGYGTSDTEDVRSDYLAAAFDALDGTGTLHVHTTCPEARFPARSDARLRAAADEHGVRVASVDARVVKSHSEGVVHGVLDAVIGDG